MTDPLAKVIALDASRSRAGSHHTVRSINDRATLKPRAGGARTDRAANSFALRPVLNDHVCCCTASFDDFFAQAVENGITQAVILGAGLDTRAWRIPWPPHGVVFEIDHSPALDFKISMMWAANAEPACEYRPLIADLDDWAPALCAAGFDATVPTAWSVEAMADIDPGAAAMDELSVLIGSLSAPGSVLAKRSTRDFPGACQGCRAPNRQLVVEDRLLAPPREVGRSCPRGTEP
jgi:methyltransferase (TIGR00027 family)